mgnify:CR=1 FL=1
MPVGNALECVTGGDQTGFIEMAANKLECDRTAAFRKAARKGNGWTSCHVKGQLKRSRPVISSGSRPALPFWRWSVPRTSGPARQEDRPFRTAPSPFALKASRRRTIFW